MLEHSVRSLPSNSELVTPMYWNLCYFPLCMCLPYLLQDTCNVTTKDQALLTTLLQPAGWVSTNAFCGDPQMILR